MAASVAVALVAGCGRRQKPSALFVAPNRFDFSANPALLPRLIESPHAYFRFINREFAAEVCRRFEPLTHAPTVNLHGDAHVEQYAVTDSGRGLTDFDDSATGPEVIDLVRMGTSLSLAADLNGWHERRSELLDALFDGLRSGIDNPGIRPAPPAVVGRIRKGFDNDRLSLLAAIDTLMDQQDTQTERLETGIDLYRRAMHTEYPRLPEWFFRTKTGGRLRVGVGSALDRKYLIRVEGPTTDPGDDLILEAKEVRDLSGIGCVQRRSGDVFKILSGQSRIAYQPYQYMGYIFLDPDRASGSELGSDFWDGTTYWVHAWVDNYQELSIADSFRTPEELAEVVYDIGVQLGRGHPKDIASPHESQLRRALIEWLDEHEAAVRVAIADMTGETMVAWRQFRDAARRSRPE